MERAICFDWKRWGILHVSEFQLFIQQPSLSVHFVPETVIDAWDYHDYNTSP